MNASRIIRRCGRPFVVTLPGAAEKIRSEHQYCRFISTFIKTSPFALNEPYYGNSASVKLLTPTQDSRDIINAATRSLDAIWQAGHRYQSGRDAGGFLQSGKSRSSIYSMTTHRAPGSEQLMTVMDTLNAKRAEEHSILPGRGSSNNGRLVANAFTTLYNAKF
ncbi:hypothetical protein ACLB1Q_08045 [Escherichia coli]